MLSYQLLGKAFKPTALQSELIHMQSARAVGDSYDMDELDSEWKELLIQLDAALLGVMLFPRQKGVDQSSTWECLNPV